MHTGENLLPNSLCPFPQHTTHPPLIYCGSTKVLIEIPLTVQYTNPWPLIPIIPAYCIVINHSLAGKYKSFHLSLCSPRIIAVSFSSEAFPWGEPSSTQETGAVVLDTIIWSYSVPQLTWQRKEGALYRFAIADRADTVAN